MLLMVMVMVMVIGDGSCLVYEKRKSSSHLFNLLQCQASCFRNEEPGENSTEGTSRAPNEEDFDAQVGFVVVDEKRYNDANDGIPEPIASRG